MIGEIIRVSMYVIIAIAFIAMLLVPVELSSEYIRKHREYKNQKKQIEFNIRVWKSIALSCDPVEDAYDKGYAIARLVIYHHELDELEKERKETVCS